MQYKTEHNYHRSSTRCDDNASGVYRFVTSAVQRPLIYDSHTFTRIVIVNHETYTFKCTRELIEYGDFIYKSKLLLNKNTDT